MSPQRDLTRYRSRLHREDLVRSSRVCQLMRNISQSLLYRRLYLTERSSPRMHMPKLHMFVRSLLTPGSEEIATYLRNLTIEWGNCGMKQTTEDLPLFTEAQSRFGLEKTQFISGDVHMILLLHLIPKLHTFHLSPPNFCYCFDKLMGSFRALQPISALPIAFQSLREFHWGGDSYHTRMGTGTLLALLRLPNISFISIWLSEKTEVITREVNAAVIAAAGTSTVTQLELQCTVFPPSSFASILAIPRALTHFSYSYRGRDIDSSGFAAFLAVLEPLRNSLQSLNIDFPRPSLDAGFVSSNRTTVGSFREWPVLKTLKCTRRVLPGRGPHSGSGSVLGLVDVLPLGISYLCIHYDEFRPFAGIAQEIMDLVERRQMVPGLRKLFVFTESELEENLVEVVTTACRAAQVRLIVQYRYEREVYDPRDVFRN